MYTPRKRLSIAGIKISLATMVISCTASGKPILEQTVPNNMGSEQVSIDASSISREVATFLQPVCISSAGLQNYFETVYNNQRYGSEFLPACFVHLNDFLDQAHAIRLPLPYTLSVFVLFQQKLKETLWVNPFAFELALKTILEQVPPLLVHEKQDRKDGIKPIIYQCLSRDFELLKRDPEAFIDALASRIVEQDCPENGTAAHLRSMITRFIESAFDKLIWNPQDGQATVDSFERLGTITLELYNRGIVTTKESANLLIWSLITRYKNFLDMTGTMIAPEVLRNITQRYNRGSNGVLPEFVSMPETESAIKSKQETVYDAANQALLTSMMKKQGLWVRE